MKSKYLRVEMPDGSKWDVPVCIIAQNRAEHYKGEFQDNVDLSLSQDTLPLFEEDDFEIHDWAANNMNWDEVEEFAKKVTKKSKVDFQEGWINGEKEIVEY